MIAADTSADWLQEPLPGIRQDLRIIDSRVPVEGEHRWRLYDPLQHRYFNLNHTALELFRCWRHQITPSALLETAAAKGVSATSEDLQALLQLLRQHHLTSEQGREARQNLVSRHKARQRSWWSWLIHNYLFIRLPILRPDPWLDKLMPFADGLSHPYFLRFLQLLGVIGLLLVFRQWDHFQATFLHFFSLQGLLFYGVALAFIKIAHEAGHAFAARRRGCRVASMGVALLVLFPVLYTDTTDASRLRNRAERLGIVLAGIKTELYLAVAATFLWSFLPDGPARSVAFFVATTSWVTSVLVNISPFMRFDGYYAMADLLEMENLQQRSFELGRWRLRQWLFGYGDPVPEASMSQRRIRLLTVYAYGTWLYRFFLFLGIALLVYHFAFKLLGIFLFAVEILWFVMLPIWREMKIWWTRRSDLRWNQPTVRSLVIFSLFLGLLLVPFEHEIQLEATLDTKRSADVFAAHGGQVSDVLVAEGDTVEAGQLLIKMQSPQLNHQLEQTKRKLKLTQAQLDRQGADRKYLEQRLVLERQKSTLLSQVAALESRIAELDVVAPVSGRVSKQIALMAGQWLSTEDVLLNIHDQTGRRVLAFVPESDLSRLVQGSSGYFFSDDGRYQALPVQFETTDRAAISRLEFPELASLYDGGIATRKNKESELVTEQAMYRMTFSVAEGEAISGWRQPGVIVLPGQSKSLIERVITQVLVVLIRESGF